MNPEALAECLYDRLEQQSSEYSVVTIDGETIDDSKYIASFASLCRKIFAEP